MYIDDKHWVKLIYRSSGQQEALWILLLLFLRINPGKITAYKFREDDSAVIDVISDPDTGMMRAAEIDTISETIYDDSEKLIDLEIENGL